MSMTTAPALRCSATPATSGPLAMVYDGPDPDEWGKLDEAYAILRSAYAADSVGSGRRPNPDVTNLESRRDVS